jgi:hypothetical protein
MCCRRIIICWLCAAGYLLAEILSAAAEPPSGGPDLFGAWYSKPSTESGKPEIGGPPSAAPDTGGSARCTPPLPCGTRLLGSVRKDGAVELQVPALRW